MILSRLSLSVQEMKLVAVRGQRIRHNHSVDKKVWSQKFAFRIQGRK